MLPSSRKSTRPPSPPIPPHPHVVQRRMELLTSDMLSRSLTLVSRGQNERAHHLLAETRSILKGLGKGGLPPLPPPPSGALPPTPKIAANSPTDSSYNSAASVSTRAPSPPRPEPIHTFTPAAGIDSKTMSALDYELESGLEWISHPAVFSRDSRKAVLQTIGVISSQRGLSFREPLGKPHPRHQKPHRAEPRVARSRRREPGRREVKKTEPNNPLFSKTIISSLHT